MCGATSSSETRGTQSIERAVRLLRELAARGATGWRQGDLAQHSGLDRGTVHRILKCLVEERLVQQRDSDKRYVIGPLNYELGLSVPERTELADTVRGALRRMLRELPRLTAVSSSLRSGNDVVCIARAGSASHISDATRTRVGQRHPLLRLASGMAIVSVLPPEEARAACADGRARLAHLGAECVARAEALVKAARRDGHVLSASVVWQGVNSIAMPFGPAGAPLGSVVVSASAGDYSAAAMKTMLPALRLAAESLTAEIGAG